MSIKPRNAVAYPAMVLSLFSIHSGDIQMASYMVLLGILAVLTIEPR